MAVIVNIDHETGDLTQYTSTFTDSGNLSVAAGAALAGTSYGLSCVINDIVELKAIKSGLNNTSGRVRARFYLDPNSLTMSNGHEFICFSLNSDDAGTLPIAIVYLNYSSGYRLALGMGVDSGVTYGAYKNITDAPHYIEIDVIRATNSTSNNGSLQWWIDGVSQETLSGKDNYDKFSKTAAAIFRTQGVDVLTSGTIYLDEMVVNDDGSEIGPVVSGQPYFRRLFGVPTMQSSRAGGWN